MGPHSFCVQTIGCWCEHRWRTGPAVLGIHWEHSLEWTIMIGRHLPATQWTCPEVSQQLRGHSAAACFPLLWPGSRVDYKNPSASLHLVALSVFASSTLLLWPLGPAKYDSHLFSPLSVWQLSILPSPFLGASWSKHLTLKLPGSDEGPVEATVGLSEALENHVNQWIWAIPLKMAWASTLTPPAHVHSFKSPPLQIR